MQSYGIKLGRRLQRSLTIVGGVLTVIISLSTISCSRSTSDLASTEPYPTITPTAISSPTPAFSSIVTVTESPTATIEPTPDPLDGVVVHGYAARLGTGPQGDGTDDYVQFLPEDRIPPYGVAGETAEIEQWLARARNTAEPKDYHNLYGHMICDGEDVNGCQLIVTDVRLPMEQTNPVQVSGLSGRIVSTVDHATSQFDDKLVLDGPLPVEIGVTSAIFENGYPMLADAIAELRDTGTSVTIDGQIICGALDVNGCQIQAQRLSLNGQPIDPLAGWLLYEDSRWGLVLRYPPEAEVRRTEGPFLTIGWDSVELVLGCRAVNDTTDIIYGRTESLDEMGWAWFLGRREVKLGWWVDGRLLGIRYGVPETVRDGGTTQRGDLVCTLSLWEVGEQAFATANMTARKHETADIILSTISLAAGADTPHANLANAAAQFCLEMNGRAESRTDDQGESYDVCIFEHGECDVWALYWGECLPPPPPTPTAVAPVEAAQSSYQNEILRFALDLPDNWKPQAQAEYVLFTRQSEGQEYVLFVGVRPEGATVPVFRSGMPEGDLVSGGAIQVLNYEVPRNLLVHDERVKVVSYDVIRSRGREFFVYLDGVMLPGQTYADLHIPEDVQAEADAIVATLQVLP